MTEVDEGEFRNAGIDKTPRVCGPRQRGDALTVFGAVAMASARK
jgi:hypothetical protein